MKKSGNKAKIDTLQFSEFSHWIDYLSFRIIDKSQIWNMIYKNFNVSKLDNDNANWWIFNFVDEVITIVKGKSSTWNFYIMSIDYQGVSIPIMCYNEYDDVRKKLFHYDWIFHFYGSFFRLDSLSWFSDWFISSIDSIFSNNFITRLDYRFDFLDKDIKLFPFSPKLIFPDVRSNKKWKVFNKWWWDEVESWQLGKKENRTVFIRMYNKQVELDTNLKKIYLYWDLVDYKTFFRLEYELWEKFCWSYRGFEKDQLLNKVFTMTWIVPGDFTWTMYSPKIVVDLKDELSRVRYIKTFRTMAQNMRKNWIDPIMIIS